MKNLKRLISLFTAVAIVVSTFMALTITTVGASTGLGNLLDTLTFKDDGTLKNKGAYIINASTVKKVSLEDEEVLLLSERSDKVAINCVDVPVELGEQYLISAKVKLKTTAENASSKVYFVANTPGKSDVANSSEYDKFYYRPEATADGWAEVYAIYSMVESGKENVTGSTAHFSLRNDAYVGDSYYDLYVKDFNITNTKELDNLLLPSVDPTFENSTAVPSEKISPEYTYITTAEIGTEESNEYLKLTGDFTASGAFTISSLPCSKGKTYVVALDAKLPEDMSGTYKATLTASKNAGNERKCSPALTTEWQRVAVSFDSTAIAKNAINFTVSGLTEGSVLIDNIEFYEYASESGNLLRARDASCELGIPTSDVTKGDVVHYKDSSDGNYCVKVSSSSSTMPEKALRFNNISLEPATMYELSVDVKLADAQDDISAVASAELLGQTNTFAIGEEAQPKELAVPVNNAQWTTLKRYFVTNCAQTTWTGNNYGMHLGVRLVDRNGNYYNNAGLMLDNFSVKKVAEPTVVTGVWDNKASIVKYGNKIGVNIFPAENTDTWIFICTYDETGARIKDVKAILEAKGVTSAGRTVAYTFDSADEMSNADVFVWNSGTMAPVCEKISLD